MNGDTGRELLILGLLRRSAMSAYSLDRAVRAHAPLYRPFRRGNVYHAVAKLAERGVLLCKSAKSRRGPQKSKTVFRLSASGDRHFHRLLGEVITDIQSPDPALEIAYVLLGQLPRVQALSLLSERSQALAKQDRRLLRIVGNIERRSGASYLGLSHTVARIRSEQRFLRDSIKLLEDPKWDREWVLNDGAIVDPRRKL